MKNFSELNVGDEFFSTCSISQTELKDYLNFSRVKNAFLEDSDNKQQIVSGRAILSRMEGEFTRLNQIYGNHLIFIGTDGDKEWNNKNTRFLKPLFTDEKLEIKFSISDKKDINEEYGRIAVNFEGRKDSAIVVISKKNLYQIKKETKK